MKRWMMVPWLLAPVLAGTAAAQTTTKTADDLAREILGPDAAAAPSGGAGVDVGQARPVPCLFDCGKSKKPTTVAFAGRPAAVTKSAAMTRQTAPLVTGKGVTHRPVQQGATRAAVNMALTFPNGSDQLDRVALPELDKYVDVLGRQQAAGLRFVIEGHTNSVGAPDTNLDLSRRRAQTVVDYLVSHGVDRDRLEPRGVGQADPLPGKSGVDAANRRVEIKPL